MTVFLVPYFTIWVVVVWSLYKKNNNIIVNDLFWLITSWVAMLGIYFFSGIAYYYIPGVKTWLYIILFFGTYILGRLVGLKTKINSLSGRKIRIKDNILLVITAVGAALRMYDIITLNGFLNINRYDIHSSFVGIIGSFLSPLGLPLFLKIGFQAKADNIKIPMKAYLALFLYVLPVILLSGRLNLIFALIAIICLTLWKPQSNQLIGHTVSNALPSKFKKKKIAITVLIFTGIVTFLRYSNYIIGNRFKSFETMLLVTGLNDSFALTDSARPFYDSFGALGALVFQVLNYYSAQFKNIALIIQEFHGPHSFGLTQLHYIARRSDFLKSIANSTNTAMRAATALSGRAFDGSGTYWVTVIGDMVIDFGTFGGLIAIFIIGILIGRKRAIYLRNLNNPYELSIQVMLSISMFYSIQLSPLFETSLVYAFLWMWVLSHFRIGGFKM